MSQTSIPYRRLIGLDCHPDTFTAAIVEGSTALNMVIKQTFDKVPISRLLFWAQKYASPEDLFLIESSGNTFAMIRTLRAKGFKAIALESRQLSQTKDPHFNNDKLSAARIARGYLSGAAKDVWVPDLLTQERRDLLHIYRKAVTTATRVRNRLLSYLSDHGVRLKALECTTPGKAEARIRKAYEWSTKQWQIIEGCLLELRAADTARRHWRSMIAQEVVSDPNMLSMVRLCGIRDLIAFAMTAIVGDIKRFKKPGSLVNYIGLNPGGDSSGLKEGKKGVARHGRRDLRTLLAEAAQSISNSKTHPLAKWGRKVLARKGVRNIAVIAVARRLTVAVWYLMMGRWTPLEELDARLSLKVGKIITEVGTKGLKALNTTRKQLRETIKARLISDREHAVKNAKPLITKRSQPVNLLGENYVPCKGVA